MPNQDTMAKTPKSQPKTRKAKPAAPKAKKPAKTPATKKSTAGKTTNSNLMEEAQVHKGASLQKAQRKTEQRTHFNSANRESAIDEILERLREGESLRQILPKTGLPQHLPSMSQFMNWLNEDSERGRALVERYTRAREAWAEIQNEEMEQIAKDCKTMVDVQRARLVIDVKKWDLSKRFPRRFGDKVDVTSGGEKISSEKITPEAARAFVKGLLEEF